MCRFCWKYLKKNLKILYSVLIIISVFTSLLSVLYPYINGKFLDFLILYKNFKIILIFCSILILIGLSNLVLGYFMRIIQTKVTSDASYALNRALVEHIKLLPYTFWEGKQAAYVNQRINNDANATMSFFLATISGIIIQVFIFTISFGLLLYVSPKILFSLLTFLILYVVIYLVLKSNIFKKSIILQELKNNFFSTLNEQLSKGKFIKLHSLNALYTKEMDFSYKKLIKSTLNYQKTSYIFDGFDSLITIFAQAVILIIGGISFINNDISIGLFTVVLNYFNMMMNSTRYFFGLGKSYQEAKASYHRIQEILKLEPLREGSVILDAIFKIDLKKVSFAYRSKSPLFCVSLSLERNKIYQIIGDNGTGKTTLCELISGMFIGDYAGEICFNKEQVELSELNLVKFRKNNIGITEQDITIYRGSIKENLMLLNTTALAVSLEEMNELISKLFLSDFLSHQPFGLDTIISDEYSNLSGGERQKIAIIRQLIQNPDVMIFDEPTAFLDQESVMAFLSILQQKRSDKIIIVVSHDKRIESIVDQVIPLS